MLRGFNCLYWTLGIVVLYLSPATAGNWVYSEMLHLLSQVQVLSGLQHERIICLLGACLAPPHICIVEELANAGSLFNHLHGPKQGSAIAQGMPYAQVGEKDKNVSLVWNF